MIIHIKSIYMYICINFMYIDIYVCKQTGTIYVTTRHNA